MLLVPTYVAPSKIAGLGLFAAAPITKDTCIWQYEENFDCVWSLEKLLELSSDALSFIRIYGHRDVKRLEYIYLCTDNGRFINHENEPNTYDAPEATYAKSDIALDEEITADYGEFGGSYDENWQLIF